MVYVILVCSELAFLGFKHAPHPSRGSVLHECMEYFYDNGPWYVVLRACLSVRLVTKVGNADGIAVEMKASNNALHVLACIPSRSG